jgi:23S rRNA (cytosine1962-C5)-methyltransferase
LDHLAGCLAFLVNSIPCVLFEDEDLLVVNKPTGINTHSPAPYAGDGLYDWLRQAEPRWASLAIVHRLDKETSGVIVFGKTPRANQSLTRQFTEHTVRKSYLFLTDRPPLEGEHRLRTALVRSGVRYRVRPPHAGSDLAETVFQPATPQAGHTCIQAHPLTGKTHQIRVHAAELGRPVLGDTLYGGSPAPRVFLHAQRLVLRHPADQTTRVFECPAPFQGEPRFDLRAALFTPAETNAYRVIHGSADGCPGWYVDRLGDVLLSQSATPLTGEQRAELEQWLGNLGCRAAYHKSLLRSPGITSANSAPQLVLGDAPSPLISILENGIRFQLDLGAGYSVGLFLDQRDNRRRLLRRHIAAQFPVRPPDPSPLRVLNAFAYTGGFSVCAGLAGAVTTSIDLSSRYLDWAKANFHLNQLNADAHHFLTGDVFEWFRRLARKQHLFDVILLDPPTFSRSKTHGIFRTEKDFARLVTAALPLLATGGTLFASANTARLPAEDFLNQLSRAIASSGRRLARKHYCAQPLDFPITREEPAHLKSVWLEIE